MRVEISGLFWIILNTSLGFGASFVVNPSILIFEPDKKNISQVATYTYQGGGTVSSGQLSGPQENNNENAPVPIEINLTARVVNMEGEVEYPSSEGADDFVVYPSQFILYPGESKKVQVQWVGSQLPGKEVSYGLISTQLPLKIKENIEQPKTAIGMVMVLTRYAGIIVVRPTGIKPDVKVDTAYYAQDTSGNYFVAILNNQGTGLQSLRSMHFSVSPYEKNGRIKLAEAIRLVPSQSLKAANQSLLAGFKRKIQIPWPAGFPVGPIHATANFPDAPK
jgi:P pilus assembly chaperone PapD